MKQHSLVQILFAILMVAGPLLTSCGPRASEVTPTQSSDQIQTLAVGTFSSELTSTALAMPTNSPTAAQTPAATDLPAGLSTLATLPVIPSSAPTSSCYGLAFVSDVSIPDNMTLSPGQKFKKTWRVRNSGSCDWAAGWKFRLTGGDAMGGSSVELNKAVQPGDETDLSVDLVAPSSAGTYRGNWRMTTGSGANFGDEVYVLIVVSGSTPTATARASATASPTATATTGPTDSPTETPTLSD